jgi:hypothetical protein
MFAFFFSTKVICGHALDLRLLYALFILQFFNYSTSTLVFYNAWWYDSGQGHWTWKIHSTSIEDPDAGLHALNQTCNWLRNKMEGRIGENASHSYVLLDCLIFSVVALIVMLLAVRRTNRFERLTFVDSFVLSAEVCDQRQLLSGRRIELLSLFSNPSFKAIPADFPLPRSRLGPLQLGRELKSLLRAVRRRSAPAQPP